MFNRYSNADTDTCTNIHTITGKSSIPIPILIPEDCKYRYQKNAITDKKRIHEDSFRFLLTPIPGYPYWALIQTPISEDTNTDVFWYQLNTTLNETTKQSCMYSSSLILWHGRGQSKAGTNRIRQILALHISFFFGCLPFHLKYASSVSTLINKLFPTQGSKYYAFVTRMNIDLSVFIYLTLIEPGGAIIIFCHKIVISPGPVEKKQSTLSISI